MLLSDFEEELLHDGKVGVATPIMMNYHGNNLKELLPSL